MATSWTHAESSVRRFGGVPQDYLAIHEWFDDTKFAYPDMRHRALKHHSLGIGWCLERFGPVVRTSEGREIPTKLVAEQHVREDLGFIPTPQEWLDQLPLQPFMVRGAMRLTAILANVDDHLKHGTPLSDATKKWLDMSGLTIPNHAPTTP